MRMISPGTRLFVSIESVIGVHCRKRIALLGVEIRDRQYLLCCLEIKSYTQLLAPRFVTLRSSRCATTFTVEISRIGLFITLGHKFEKLPKASISANGCCRRAREWVNVGSYKVHFLRRSKYLWGDEKHKSN